MQYKIFGVARDEANDPQVKEIGELDGYPESEITDGIISVVIEAYGDTTSMAFVQVTATDKQKGIELYNKIVEHWRFELQRALWGPK